MGIDFKELYLKMKDMPYVPPTYFVPQKFYNDNKEYLERMGNIKPYPMNSIMPWYGQFCKNKKAIIRLKKLRVTTP